MDDQATAAEEEQLMTVIMLPENDELWQELVVEIVGEEPATTQKQDWTAVIGHLRAAMQKTGSSQQDHTPTLSETTLVSEGNTRPPVHQVHFLRRNWLRYAAVLAILIGAGIYYLLSDRPGSHQPAQKDPVMVKADVAPGGNRATITLADGSVILLDSAANGQLAQQGNASIEKLSDGEIRYSTRGTTAEANAFNTMSTPRGGIYQLTLPDGTRVWLNAESAITYPVAFATRERKVSVKGEVYFEVAKDAARPFLVSTGPVSISVLGTQFNVNAYPNETGIRTTLLEGSVNISSAGGVPALLKPGQQAVAEAGSKGRTVQVLTNADTDKVMAWKNGLFNFDNVPLEEAMKQLARWYDIDIQYEKQIPDIRFAGKLDRNLKLSEVLSALEGARVHFRIEGKTLVITP